MNQPLGKTQRTVLEIMVERRFWHINAGWKWDCYSATDTILKSLAKRGLVDQIDDKGMYGHYRINDKGKATIERVKS